MALARMLRWVLVGIASGSVGGLVACGSAGISAGGDGDAGVTIGTDGVFGLGGTCVLPTYKTRAAGGSCTASSYGGRATAVNVKLLSGIGSVVLGDTGPLPTTGGTRESTLLDAQSPGLLAAHAVKSSISGAGSETLASSEVTAANLGLAGIGITADVLASNAHAACAGGVRSHGGGTIITNLRIDGTKVDLDAAPNTTIEVRGVLRIVANEQRVEANGAFTVTALHITVLSLLNAADIRIATATADATCGCTEAPAEDGGTVSSSGGTGSSSGGTGSSSGGSTSSSGGTGSSSGGSSSGDCGCSSSGGSSSSSGGSSSGSTSSSGGSSSGSSGSSGTLKLGAPCDDEHACAAGLRCEVTTPIKVN